MAATNKSSQALKNISEVSELLGIETHVLRYWEQRFPWISPVRRAGGRRYYRKDDVELLQIIKILLKDKELSIRGAQKIIRETSRSDLIKSWLNKEQEPLTADFLPTVEEEASNQSLLPFDVDERTLNLPARQKLVLRGLMDELVNIHILLQNEKVSIPPK
ncbi:MAG: MerR family transcriptional regulator [Alphaproteobacteria bacterium]